MLSADHKQFLSRMRILLCPCETDQMWNRITIDFLRTISDHTECILIFRDDFGSSYSINQQRTVHIGIVPIEYFFKRAFFDVISQTSARRIYKYTIS